MENNNIIFIVSTQNEILSLPENLKNIENFTKENEMTKLENLFNFIKELEKALNI